MTTTVSSLLQARAHPEPAGEVFAFPAIYEGYFDFVWRSARCLGVEAAALDDVVQEIFVVVHRGLPEFEGRSTLRTWISGIVLNVVRRHRRTVRRKSPHELADDAPDDPETLPAHGRDPYEAAAHAEETRLLQRLLSELDDDKREVLVLAELEELPVPEIAEALGIKLNTAYSRLRLARQELDRAIARHHARNHRRSP
jgi:RNA polymerase sigma-70 factor (ECF subfamily)